MSTLTEENDQIMRQIIENLADLTIRVNNIELAMTMLVKTLNEKTELTALVPGPTPPQDMT